MVLTSAFDKQDYLKLEAERQGGVVCDLQMLGGASARIVARAIPQSGGLSDGVSVYGYPSLPDGENLPEMIARFTAAARTKSLVAAYLRFGAEVLPAQDASTWQLRDVGEIITVDLARPYDEIEAGFRKSLRYDIRKARNYFGPAVRENAAGEFYRIYTENMARVGAADQYFFTADYFSRLLAIDGFDCWTVRKDGVVAAAAITAEQGSRLYYHLGATANEFVRDNPVKHLLASIIAEYAQQPFCGLVLGGGVGGQRDSLFKFKTGFSANISMSQSLCIICDPETYDALSNGQERFGGYFPAYRG